MKLFQKQLNLSEINRRIDTQGKPLENSSRLQYQYTTTDNTYCIFFLDFLKISLS